VIPVIALDDIRHALPLADVLAEDGLCMIEVTFRTSAAVDTIRQIAQHRVRSGRFGAQSARLNGVMPRAGRMPLADVRQGAGSLRQKTFAPQ
jgi:hypothetical protein